MEVIDTEIEDLEELLVLSKDNTTELNELKNQLSEIEQKILANGQNATGLKIININ